MEYEKETQTRDTNREKDPRYIRHFGIWINKTLPSAQISREHYATINPRASVYSYAMAKYQEQQGNAKRLIIDDEKQAVFYKPEYCLHLQKRALANYDLNMERFASIDADAFERNLISVVKSKRFQEISSLEDAICGEEFAFENECEGFLYIMVLDRFKQAYVGMTRNSVKTRIQQHWKNKRAFDRLVFGTVENSVISIDSFGPLDTTRIFVKPYPSKRKTYIEKYEIMCIKAFEEQFLLNRLT